MEGDPPDFGLYPAEFQLTLSGPVQCILSIT